MAKSTITLMPFLISDQNNPVQPDSIGSLANVGGNTTNTQDSGISSLSDLGSVEKTSETTGQEDQTFSLANPVKPPSKGNWQDYTEDAQAQKEEETKEEPKQEPKSEKKDLKPYKKTRFKAFPKFMGFLVLALILVTAVYLFQLYDDTRSEVYDSETESSNLLGDDEIVYNEVSKIIMLPQDEMPVIRTVTNAKLLSGQSFFKDAQNGDKVLIYQESQKAILYRPTEGKLVNVASVNLGNVVDDTPAASEDTEIQGDEISMVGDDVRGAMTEDQNVIEDPDGVSLEEPLQEGPAEPTESVETDTEDLEGSFTDSIFGQLNDQKPLIRVAVYTNGYSYDEKIDVQNSIKDQLVDYRFDFYDYKSFENVLARNSLIGVNDVDTEVEQGIVKVTNARVYDSGNFGIDTAADLVLVLVK